MASNMVDLLKNINTKPLQFPSDVKVNPVLIDVLKKMLTPDVKKRISWNDLFSHPINRYLDNLVRKEIDLELIEDESLMINTSKYYLKKNLVMAKP
jgi:serine/threonine protein kinase